MFTYAACFVEMTSNKVSMDTGDQKSVLKGGCLRVGWREGVGCDAGIHTILTLKLCKDLIQEWICFAYFEAQFIALFDIYAQIHILEAHSEIRCTEV